MFDNPLPLLLALGVFAGALVSGFTGFAFSAVAGAVLLHVLPPVEAIPLMMACSVLVQSTSLVSLRRSVPWRNVVPLIGGGLAGLPLALYYLRHGDPAVIRAGFGIFLAAYAAYMLFRPKARYLEHTPGSGLEAAVGFVGGLLGGITAMPGAIPAIWCDLRGIPKEQQRGKVQPYIAAMQIAALAFLAMQRGLPQALAGYLLYAAIPLVAGVLLGLALFGKVSDALFRRALLCVLLASGLGYVL
jgi:uncharacterized membrane protein YfcA